jgi:HAD superfamily hydrolase (TIGR01509 family)
LSLLTFQKTTLLFDCDNTLVLSEELAFEACALLANELLAKNNVEQRYTGPVLMNEFVGQNFRGVVVNLQKKFGFPLSEEELESYVKAEEGKVIETIEAKGQPCTGVNAVLETLSKDESVDTMAVVSSSALRRVVASIKKVDQAKYFGDLVFSAATSLPVPTTKPDPAIYLHACKVIGKKPSECVAIEDSKSGTLSATRAGIPVVGYTGCYEKEGDEKMDEMAKILTSAGAGVIMKAWDIKTFRDCVAKVQGSKESL